VPYFVEIPLSSGETILAEVTGQVEDLAPVGSRGRDVLGRLPETFTDALDRVQAFAGEALSRMKKYHEPPDRVTVEFGLNFSAKAGVFIAESAAEAHLIVTAEWCRSASSPRSNRAGTPASAEGSGPEGPGADSG
jgi:hypothetical protein